jgi:hypothetical protein
MKGFYTITKSKEDKIVYCKSFENLILTTGLIDAWDNRIQQMSRIHIGDGTTAVNINQSTLANELSNHAASSSKLLSPGADKSGFVYTSTLALGEFTGTIRELGISRGVGNPLFSRVLLDTGVIVYSDEQLTITYTIEFNLSSINSTNILIGSGGGGGGGIGIEVGSGSWVGGVLGLDGKIYGVPYNATSILIFDPVDGTATTTNMGADLTGIEKWVGGSLGSDGKIYCTPVGATDILIIDPSAGTATRSNMGASLTGVRKWWGSVVGNDGKIYGIPWDSTTILIIDPIAGTATRSNMGADLTGGYKWVGGCLGLDNKIYSVPYNATDILIIDPSAGTATRSNMGASLTGITKWFECAISSTGQIYCAPYNATDILIIDPLAGTATRSNMGADLTGTTKWSGVVFAPNNKMYGIPFNATDILIINLTTQTATRSNMGTDLSGTNKWFGGLLGSDDKIYGTPWGAANMLIIDPSNDTASQPVDYDNTVSIYPFYLIEDDNVSSLPTYLKYQTGSAAGVVRPYLHTAAITPSDEPLSVATDGFVLANVVQLTSLLQEITITVPADNTATTLYGFTVTFGSTDLSNINNVGHTISFNVPISRTVGQIFTLTYRWSLNNV